MWDPNRAAGSRGRTPVGAQGLAKVRDSHLMFILLNHYMLIEVMRYLNDNKLPERKLNAFLRPTALFVNKAKWAFYIFLHCIVFYDVKFTVWPLYRPIIAL